ncbi:MAG: aminotransferase class I/II-fold pyridoxal phosphate-dependent enzyme [Clostridiales bacterium]|nr:aminotransferase class I/II-fold pyridoxal phosphate-dependent enzyme [Clostridiales bacterium]
MKRSLYKMLLDYIEEDYLPMHMPGGKRKEDLVKMPDPIKMDITEIGAFDNLHNPTGIIKEEMDRASSYYKADQAFILVNGSTAGVMSAVCGACKRGDKILVARNCHISAYNAVELRGLEPFFIYPELADEKAGIFGRVSPEEVEYEFKKDPDIKAFILTSPTYEGIVSDTRRIAEIVHSYGAVLIVDEAHGAHFPFSSEFPSSSNETGADAVITSLHKTMPAFTSTALLFLNDDRINADRVKYFLNMFQTTSPSYILMGSISACFDLIDEKGPELFNTYVVRLKRLRQEIGKLENIRLMDTDDLSKIVLLAEDGNYLYNRLLKDFKIEVEMTSFRYVIAMTSLADSQADYDRFCKALEIIDSDLANASDGSVKNSEYAIFCLEHKKRRLVWEAAEEVCAGAYSLVDLEGSEGRVVGDNIVIYPPGIPEIVRGEEMDLAAVKKIKAALDMGFDVLGIEKDNLGRVLVRCL